METARREKKRGEHAKTLKGTAASGRFPSVGDIALAICVGALVSCSYFAREIYQSGAISSGGASLAFAALKLAAGALLVACAVLALFRLFDSPRFARVGSRFADRALRARPTNVAALTAVILAAWAPAAFLMTPFYIGADTIAQLLWHEGFPVFDPSSREFLPDASMSDHHPVFDTLVYGLFYDLGQAAGNPAWGMTALCIVQLVLMAAVFAYGCCWLRAKGVPAALCALALVFWACNPVFPMLLMQVVKDITSMPFFLLWFFAFVDALLAVRAGAAPSRGRFVALTALTLACSLMRKTLLYITVPSLAVLGVCALVAMRRAKSAETRQAMLASFAGVVAAAGVSCAVMLLVLPKVVFPLAGVAPGGVQEMLSVPIQQVSRVVVEEGDSLTEADRNVIASVLPIEELPSLYTPYSADPVKDSWNRDATGSDTLRFLGEWVQLGIRHPAAYAKAAQYLLYFWTAGSYCNDTPVIWWGWEDRGGAELFPDLPGGYRTAGQELLDNTVQSVWANVPVLGLTLEVAFYTLWTPAFVAACCLRRRPWNLLLLVPLFLTMATLLIVPAFQPRYAFNMLFLFPAMLGMPFLGDCSERQKNGAPSLLVESNANEGHVAR